MEAGKLQCKRIAATFGSKMMLCARTLISTWADEESLENRSTKLAVMEEADV